MAESKEKTREQLQKELDALKLKIAQLEISNPQLYIDIAEVMLLSLNAEGIVQLINPKGCEVLGYTSKEIVGRNWFDLVIPRAQRKMVKEVAKKVFEGEIESVKYFENNIVTKSGEERLMAFHNSVIKDNKGNIISTLSSGEDITERKKAELNILLNESRLESLLKINEHQSESVQELLDFALNEAIKLTGSKIGYIYFYDEIKQEFTLNTWSKEVMKECRVMEPQTIYYLEKTGIWGEAVRQRKRIMINDFQEENPLKKGTPEGHVILNKFLTIPVFSEDKIVAVVGVANKDEDYNESDIRQLNLMIDAVWKIVQRRHAEEKLVQSEEKFRSVFEQSPLGKSMTGLDGSLKVNKAFSEIVGYSEEELRAMNWKEITHPDDIQASEDVVTSLTEGKRENAKYKKRYIHKDGRVIWAELVTGLIKDQNGKPQFFITAVNDITKRKHSEMEIKRYSHIFEDSLNEIYLFDAETFLFTQVNKAAQKNLGYSIEELKEMSVLDIKPEFTKTRFVELIEPLKNKSKQEVVFETVHQRKDRTKYPVEVHLQFIQIEDETIFAAIILDISKRKIAEEELRKYREILEELVKERTNQLEAKNKELNNAMKVFVGREMTIRNLQERIRALEGK